MGEIYKVENIVNHKIYIGKTSRNMLLRKRDHLYKAKRDKRVLFHNAIRKYGPESFEWSVLFMSEDDQELSKKEIEFIAQHQSMLPEFGYNLTHGGEGQRCNDATRKKMSEKARLQVKTPESIEKQRQSLKEYYKTHHHPNTGRVKSEEEIEKQREGLKNHYKKYGGRPISEAHKQAVSRAQKGRKRTPEEIEKNRKWHLGKSPANKGTKRPECSQPVLCVETQEVFSSMLEAMNKYPSAGTHISQVCSGKRKSAGGFHWKYLV